VNLVVKPIFGMEMVSVKTKNKINSIGYGHKILLAIGICLIIIPICCQVLNSLVNNIIFSILMNGSLIIGTFILVFFIVLLSIEFRQDKNIIKQYTLNKRTKMALGDGTYECQSCGNRIIKAADAYCGICGTIFNTEGSD
jgi:hypothetical protein